MKRLLITLLVICILGFNGCQSSKLHKDPNIKNAIKQLENVEKITVTVQKNLDESGKIVADVIIKNEDSTSKSTDSANIIKNEANTIKDTANKIDNKTDGKVKDEVNAIIEGSDKIITEADTIIALQKLIIEQNTLLLQVTNTLEDSKNKLSVVGSELKDANSKLEKSEKKISELEAALAAKDEEIKEANSEAKQQLNAKLIWMVIGGVLMIAICVASALNGNAKAWTFAGVGIVVVITCLCIMHFYTQLAWVGLICAVVVVVLLFFKVKRDNELKKANKELVHSTEVIKESLNTKQKEELFGKGAKPGVLYNIQSTSTEKLVNDERKVQATHWRPTLDK
jgi:uncharacterized membrane protein